MRYVAAAIALLVIGLGLGWVAREATLPVPASTVEGPTDASALDSLDAAVRRLRGHFEQLRETTSDEENRLRRPRTPSYSLHLERADSLGVPPLTGEGDLSRLLAAGRLVPLVDNEFYVVRILEHSKPFVTPLLAARLAEVGVRFQQRLAEAGLPPYRFSVSSAQRALGQSNRNAAVGRSSHEYGASADIVYTRYAGPLRPDTLRGDPVAPGLAVAQALAIRWEHDLAGTYDDRLFGTLARVLHEMQEEERLVVLLEDEQPVFHVTTDAGG